MDWGFSPVHYTKELYMNATTTYLNAITNHINSRIAIAEAQAKFVVTYNTFTKAEQGTARDAIAELIAKRTGVKPVVMSKGATKGRLGFTSKRSGGSPESEAARKMFEYYTPKVIVETSSTTRKAVDPVAQLLEKFESLTAAQKRKFLASV
jgi:hypothetical protein